MVKVGQLRKFNYTGEIFTVIDRQGEYYAPGSSTKIEDYFSILTGGEIQSGWPSSLLEDESKIVSKSPSHTKRS